MAERRMFNGRMLSSDYFLDLPLNQQALYFQLCLHADDDGFLGNAKTIARMLGLSPAVLEEMKEAGFLILFESGVTVIRHWRIHNAIRKDRYVPTMYQEEFARLTLDHQDTYQMQKSPVETSGCQAGNHAATQERIGKVMSGKDRRESAPAPVEADEPDCRKAERQSSQRVELAPKTSIPTREEVHAFAREHHSRSNPDRFYDYYAARNWNHRTSPIQDWQAAFRCWENRESEFKNSKSSGSPRPVSAQMYSQRDYSGAEESVDEIMTRLNQMNLDHGTHSKSA